MKIIDRILVTFPFLFVLFLTIFYALKVVGVLDLWNEIQSTGINPKPIFITNLAWSILLAVALLLWFIRRRMFVPYLNGLTILFLLYCAIEAWYFKMIGPVFEENWITYLQAVFFLLVLNYSTIKNAYVRSKHGASS